MSLPIDFTAIWNGVITAAVLAFIGLIATLVYKLWRLPDYQREVLDEITLMRITFWEMFPDAHHRVEENLRNNNLSNERSKTLRERARQRL